MLNGTNKDQQIQAWHEAVKALDWGQDPHEKVAVIALADAFNDNLPYVPGQDDYSDADLWVWVCDRLGIYRSSPDTIELSWGSVRAVK